MVSEQFLDPAQQQLDSALALLGRGPLATPMFDAISLLPDLHLQTTVPGFDCPRRDLAPSLRFIRALPPAPGDAALPDWADEIDGSRRAVLVT